MAGIEVEMAVDPVSLVVGALAAGASTGVTDVASSAVKDAYAGLKAALAERFRGRPSAEVALAEHEACPATWQAPLEQYVGEVGVDTELEQLARRLLEAVRSGGDARQVQINAETIQGQQVGDGNTQTNTFGG